MCVNEYDLNISLSDTTNMMLFNDLSEGTKQIQMH